MDKAERRSAVEGNVQACEECISNCRLMHWGKTDLSSPVSRFIKILVGEWPRRLILPPDIAETVADKVGKEAYLENAFGKKWTVTLSPHRDGLAFQKGWEDFVTDHNLSGGDALVFNYVKGSNFVVHVFGKTGKEKVGNDLLRGDRSQGNASAQLKQTFKRSALEPTFKPFAPGPTSKPSAPGPISKPSASGPNSTSSAPGPNSRSSAPGPNSRSSAPGPKSKLSSVPQRICERSLELRAQDYGGDDVMADTSNYVSNHEVHESKQAYGNKKIMDGGISPNPHTDIRLQAEAYKYFIGTENLESNIHMKVTDVSITEKDHAGTRSLAEASKDSIGTKNKHKQSNIHSKVADVSITEKDHAGMRSLAEANKDHLGTKNMKSNMYTKVTDVSMTEKDPTGRRSREAINDHMKDPIRTENVVSNIYSKVTDVSMTEKDPTSLRSLAESNKDLKSNGIPSGAKFSLKAKGKPLVLRDYNARKCGKGTSANLSYDHPFGYSSEEPGQKGNDQNSPGANYGAVYPMSGQKSTGCFEKIMKKDQQERSEPGCNGAKRQRDFESAPEVSSAFKLVKMEPCDDTSSDQDVTCLAVTHGPYLELPAKLPALRYLRRGSKVVYLLDHQRRQWPALYEERSGLQVLRCHWDVFNPLNGVQDGDSYVFTVEDASEFIYRISVLHSI